jgi:hypothetical protein
MRGARERGDPRGGSNQLIETYREDGKVKQRILANLGPLSTVEEAIAHWEKHLPIYETRMAEHKAHLEVAKEHLARRKKQRENARQLGFFPGVRKPENESVAYRYPRYFIPSKWLSLRSRLPRPWTKDVVELRQKRARSICRLRRSRRWWRMTSGRR